MAGATQERPCRRYPEEMPNPLRTRPSPSFAGCQSCLLNLSPGPHYRAPYFFPSFPQCCRSVSFLSAIFHALSAAFSCLCTVSCAPIDRTCHLLHLLALPTLVALSSPDLYFYLNLALLLLLLLLFTLAFPPSWACPILATPCHIPSSVCQNVLECCSATTHAPSFTARTLPFVPATPFTTLYTHIHTQATTGPNKKEKERARPRVKARIEGRRDHKVLIYFIIVSSKGKERPTQSHPPSYRTFLTVSHSIFQSHSPSSALYLLVLFLLLSLTLSRPHLCTRSLTSRRLFLHSSLFSSVGDYQDIR